MKRMVMSAMMAGVLAVPALAQEKEAAPSWADSVKVSGDLRLRHEYIDQEGKVERHRQRVRARFGLDAQVDEQVKVEVKVATGESDEPISTNQSFDNAFAKKSLWLDLAYLEWTATDQVKVIGGKMKQPWIGVSDLIWDGDLNPEGVAVKLKLPADAVALMANAGGFWIDELSGTTKDRMLYFGQLAVEGKAGGVKATLGGTVYAYENMKGLAPVYDAEDSFGNDVIETEAADGSVTLAYANDFLLYEIFGALDLKVGEMPVKLYAQGVSNDDAATADMGYLVGVRLGQTKAPGQMQLDYSYRDLEANAVVGAFTDSDSFGGGTDGEGHRIKGSVALTKRVQADATLFVNSLNPGGKDTDYTRVQLDLVAKF